MTTPYQWAMAEIKSLSKRRQKRVKRRLWKKIDRPRSVTRMHMKDVVEALILEYGENARKIVSSIIKKTKHRRRRSPQDEDDVENQTSVVSKGEVVDHQMTTEMDVPTTSDAIQARGVNAEHREPLGNLATSQLSNFARDGSSIIAPRISGCSVQGNISVNIYAGENTEWRQTLPDPELITDQIPQSRPVPLYSQKAEKENIERIRNSIKSQLKKRNESVLEGVSQKKALNGFYTELHIVACHSTSVNTEHEVWLAENAHHFPEGAIVNCNDIFKPDDGCTIKCVVTKGIAGIGKTVAVAKFSLDWAEGKTNEDLYFIFVLPFRELNLIKKQQYSLHGLLEVFHPQLRDVKEMKTYDEHNILFILDGLDESQLPLKFDTNKLISDVTESATLDVLLTNLISSHLLPKALIWITTRPVAANKIPAENVDRVTEIRGFNDPQKDEYFRLNVRAPEMAERIILVIKERRSLYIMCHIPMFCWMAATVLQDILGKDKDGLTSRSLPTTLTEMYIHYLLTLTQTRISFKKYKQKVDIQDILTAYKDIILKLGKLAFKHLQRQNFFFTEQDLKDCGISVTEAAMCPGLCTEIVELEYGLYPKNLYCFVHLSVQEFLAALYEYHEFTNKSEPLKTLIKTRESLLDFLKGALKSSLESENGHLDLYTRFLFGISHDSSQRLLQGILPKMSSSSNDHKKLIGHVKILKRKDLSPERCVNLIHCLIQLKDPSVLKNDTCQISLLTPYQCTLRAYMHVMSEGSDEFDFRNQRTSEGGFDRLVPALSSCTTALLNFCDITLLKCATVASVLRSATSRLTILDLGHNKLGDGGVTRLCDGLRSSNCKVEFLSLRHNDLEATKKGSRGVTELCKVLTVPTTKLLTLDLSCNDLGDRGAELLALALTDGCKLQVLRLSGCRITEKGWSSLVEGLGSNPSHMKELDLSYNPLGVVDEGLLKLEKLDVDHGEDCRNKPGLQKYACQLTLDPNTAHSFLSLSEGGRRVTRLRKEERYPGNPERFDKCNQVLCEEGLRGRHYLEFECRRDVLIGMAYHRMGRKGPGAALGHNADSWSLYISKDKCHAEHDTIVHNLSHLKMDVTVPYRVGVYLDWPAGILAFYRVDSGTVTPLYGFQTTFTDSLHPGFRLNSPDAAVTLIND